MDPKYLALMSRAGQALEAKEVFSEVLKSLEEAAIKESVRRVRDKSITGVDALSAFIEITAYRNIARELEQRVESGRKAELRATRELQS